MICAYLLLDPAEWLIKLMQFTPMNLNFKMFILLLVLVGFACSWFGERKLFPQLAGLMRRLNTSWNTSRRKRRKEYKMVLEDVNLELDRLLL